MRDISFSLKRTRVVYAAVLVRIHSFHDILKKGVRVLESYTECQKASQQVESVQTMVYVAKPLLQAIEVQSTFIPRVQSFP